MRTLLALLCLALVPTLLGAQGREPSRSDDGPLISRGDAAIGAGFVLGSAVLWPVDRYLATRIQDSTVQAVRVAHRAATVFNTLGRPGTLVVSGALLAAGAAAGREGVRDVGRHGLEAVVLAELLTRGVKGIAGRARPNANPDDPRDFELGRGFGDNRYQSFFSGHASDAFAAATVFTAETARRNPGWEWPVGAVMYGTAAMVGVSRMYDNKHWATDVLAGAALGTFVGLLVVRFHDRSDDDADDEVVPEGGSPGATVSLTLRGGGLSLGAGPGW
jgi:membrane-associated phospholipid phosphatase